MRKTLIAQRSVFDQSIDTLVALFKPDAKLRKMDQIMDANPQVLELVHNDLTCGLSKSGAWGMSAEQVLRAAIIRQWKQYSEAFFAEYLVFFFIGYFLPADKRFTESIKKHGWLCLILGLASYVSKKTVLLIKAPINGVLSHPVESELIENNPLNDLKFSRKKQKFIVKSLTELQANQLLEQSKIYINGFYYPPLLCALRTGMRVGEIMALRWADVDFENRQIEVKRSFRNGGLTGTKNDKRRHVDMTPHLSETLKRLQTDQKKRALNNGWPFPEWVFANRRGKMLRHVAFRRALKRCLEMAKLSEIRIHDLRHSYATIRLLRGHNVGDVSYQLGHSSIQITYDVYGHWIPGHFKSEVDDLDEMHPNAPQAHPAKTEG